MSNRTFATLIDKPGHASIDLNPGRIREITAGDCVAELNRVVDRHNAMALDFLRCLVWLNRQLAIYRRKAAQFDGLLDENNRLLELAQRAQMLQDENDHLWRVIADLDGELRRIIADD